jgi:Uma2 family endonuclease
MAMPDVVERFWTPEDVRQLPDDGNRYECIDGVLLVTPGPAYDHVYTVEGFFRALDAFAIAMRPAARLYQPPADVELEPRSVVQPDLFVARPRIGLDRIRRAADIRDLLLAVEVLSPGTARIDRGRKRAFYQRCGVQEYWIVDHEARLVERWRPSDLRPEIIRDTLEWLPEGAQQSLRIDLPALFSEALGE